jgi:hypothetical protein
MLLAALLLPCAVFVGCEHGPKMYKVKGTVHYKDGSVPQGSLRIVCFVPATDSSNEIRKGGSGEIQQDGSFQVTTRMFDDGLYAGDYAIILNTRKTDNDPKPIVDSKYIRVSTTPLKVKVDHNIDDLKLEVEPAS